MKIKQVKTIFIVVMCVAIFLMSVSSGTGKDAFGIIGIILTFAGIGFWIIFGRCPHCVQFVGKAPGEYCKHCGKKFEE